MADSLALSGVFFRLRLAAHTRRNSNMRGKVKWFNDRKGYGFITTESGTDVFVHHTAIQADGYRTLAEGQEVEFEVETGPKGEQASKVSKL
jgi:CspA family cold shock protein